MSEETPGREHRPPEAVGSDEAEPECSEPETGGGGTASEPSGPQPTTHIIGRASAVALWGLTGKIVSIEAGVSAGLPGIDIVGLPDASVSESRKRLRAALAYLGRPVATQHLTINLTPGTVPKIGTGFDLGIAVAVLRALSLITNDDTGDVVHCGEIGLDGRIRPVTGVLPSLHTALQAGFDRFVVPVGNADEAALIGRARILPVASLAEVVNAYGGSMAVPALPAVLEMDRPVPVAPELHDLAEVQGQAEGRFGLEVAAAGGHNLLMRGTPGVCP